jgi:ribonuclease P protein component
MKKVNILKSNRDFDRIIKNNRSYRFNSLYIYIERNNDSTYHFGISVSKKIGNAVTRNLYKRRIKSIIDKNIYQNGFNCIIILKKSVLAISYLDLEEEIIKAFNIIKIIKE